MDLSEACLLGSFMGNEDTLSAALKVEFNSPKLWAAGWRISQACTLLLLWNSLSISKLHNLLWLSLFFPLPSPLLKRVPQVHLSSINNITLWLIIQLGVRILSQCGKVVIGICCAGQLAPSAYLATAAASPELKQCILPNPLQSHPFPDLEAALSMWSYGHDHPPSGKADSTTKTLDTYKGERMLFLSCRMQLITVLMPGSKLFQQRSLLHGYILSQFPLWVLGWVTKLSMSHWVFIWVQLCASPTLINIMCLKLSPMVAAIGGVRVAIITLKLSIAYSPMHCRLLGSHQDWYHQVSID